MTKSIEINNQEYICEETTQLAESDFFIEDEEICKVIHVGSGMFQYKVINKENTFGWKSFTKEIDMSKLLPFKAIFKHELKTIFNKIIGIGFCNS